MMCKRIIDSRLRNPPIALERKASRGRREAASEATEQRQSAKIRSIYCSVALLLSASAGKCREWPG